MTVDTFNLLANLAFDKRAQARWTDARSSRAQRRQVLRRDCTVGSCAWRRWIASLFCFLALGSPFFPSILHTLDARNGQGRAPAPTRGGAAKRCGWPAAASGRATRCARDAARAAAAGGRARAGLHLVCGACRHRSDASRLASTVRRLP